MRLANRSASIVPWLGLLLGFFVCSLPLMALAAEFKPPRRGLPGRREGGGTRDPFACTQGNPSQLTALLPATNLGLATAAYPRFFWFMPKTKAKSAEFMLSEVDEQMAERKPIYKTTFNLTGKAGIASLRLPHSVTIPPLVVGKDYHWSVALICNAGDRTRDINVDGWIQRVEPDAGVASQLAKAKPRDRAQIYASNGIWFDTITTLADQRCANPKDTALAASWTAMLKSVQLDAIATQPLIQPCQ